MKVMKLHEHSGLFKNSNKNETVKQCIYCGKLSELTANFCSNCGEKI